VMLTILGRYGRVGAGGRGVVPRVVTQTNSREQVGVEEGIGRQLSTGAGIGTITTQPRRLPRVELQMHRGRGGIRVARVERAVRGPGPRPEQQRRVRPRPTMRSR
jgi:hypothetical protein